jgi:CubicO group peptidase (beta-lactamase class C family)
LVLAPGQLGDTFLPPPRAEDGRLAHVAGVPAAGSAGAMYTSEHARDLAHPAFAVVATVDDLLRFGLGFIPGQDCQVLSAAAIQTMSTDQVSALSLVEPDCPPRGTTPPWGAGFMLKGAAGFPAMAAPGSFGHGAGTGCIVWVDPAAEAVIAFVLNRHANADPGQQVHAQRLERVVNVVLGCLTGGCGRVAAR